MTLDKPNKAKCPLHAVETPLSLLHCHTCLIRLLHVMIKEVSEIFYTEKG